MNRLTLALDVMGGDFGPRITIPAILKALDKNPLLSVRLFGDEHQIVINLPKLSHEMTSRIQIIHTDKVVDEHLPFMQAIRQSKESSMRLAIEAVAHGEAQGIVSGGNTGILMGLAKQLIAPLPNIDRPALTSLIPTIQGKSSVMLDLGANVETDGKQLQQFAEMGAIFAELMLGLVYPRVGLLNIGTEEYKGTSLLREVHTHLRNTPHLNYTGFIEGDKLMNHVADVIVCDGFSGNVALKTLEGMAKNVLTLLRQTDQHSDLCRRVRNALLRFILRPQYRKLQQINPDRHNGATLLGLSNVVVKSHGGASCNAYYYAIDFAINQIRQNIPQQLAARLQAV